MSFKLSFPTKSSDRVYTSLLTQIITDKSLLRILQMSLVAAKTDKISLFTNKELAETNQVVTDSGFQLPCFQLMNQHAMSSDLLKSTWTITFYPSATFYPLCKFSLYFLVLSALFLFFFRASCCIAGVSVNTGTETKKIHLWATELKVRGDHLKTSRQAFGSKYSLCPSPSRFALCRPFLCNHSLTLWTMICPASCNTNL